MRPTRGQVKTQFQNLLDDPAGAVFSDAVFQPAFSEAYDALFTALLTNQCPRLTNIINVTVPPLTPSLTPLQMGIVDFGDYEWLSERPFGSSDRYSDLEPLDRLQQRTPTDRLLEFVYRNDTFYFVGATGVIDLRIEYETSGEAPATDDIVINLDGCSTFLSNYAAGVAGGRKGYDEIANRCMLLAVGPKYDLGSIGGELFRIVQTRVRSRQHVQIAHKPFTASRRVWANRAVPYVAAQQGTTGGGAQNVPIQFSSATGTIVGAIDGSNTVFVLSIGQVQQMVVAVNGQTKTGGGIDYTAVDNQITFVVAPTTGQVVTAEAYLNA